MEKEYAPNKKKLNIIINSANTYCQCNLCDAVFDYTERGKKSISFGMMQDACPKCGGSFTVIKWKHGLSTIGDKYLMANPNEF